MNTYNLDTVKILHADIERIQAQLSAAVAEAARTGASWAAIGDALGVSKQTAHARYGKAKPAAQREAPSTEASDRAALRNITSKISDTEVAGDSVTPSIFSDAQAPAKQPKRPNGPKADPDERIRNGITDTAGKPLDWTAAQSLATTTPKKCPYCEQRTHYGNRTGNWWLYPGCTITHDDLGTKALQDTYQETNA